MKQSATVAPELTVNNPLQTISLPVLEGTASELPAVLQHPLRLSQISTDSLSSTAAGRYTASWVRNADPAGEFAQKVKPLLAHADGVLLSVLRGAGYDGFLFTHKGEVFAHAFFQAKGDEWHLFSVAVAPNFRGHGIGGDVVGAVISHARDDVKVERLKIGNGGHQFAINVCEQLCTSRNQFNARVDSQGWVTFDRANNHPRLVA